MSNSETFRLLLHCHTQSLNGLLTSRIHEKALELCALIANECGFHKVCTNHGYYYIMLIICLSDLEANYLYSTVEPWLLGLNNLSHL